ncbi:hypothetical protein [Paenibacillus lignilyticus]|uniref:ABC transporter ATP-binding protein n=1 Tax=Paenibacillus lignilyticus TaxID=1172615 RepID=A0ABS5CCK2_9BACL|nr:hypothetical protein [Paenibacillus lignilyticus]MBP3962863.1 hypothetical protein [Paenibacillus lignilyticus]
MFTHALLIRGGEVVRSGRTEDVLTTNGLSEFFEAPVVVEKHGDRIYVRVAE